MKKYFLSIVFLFTYSVVVFGNCKSRVLVDLYSNEVKDSVKIDRFKHFVKKMSKMIQSIDYQYKVKVKDHDSIEIIRVNELKKYTYNSFQSERYWDSIHDIKYKKHVSKKINLKKEVFGFHPYWEGAAYKSYNYNLLSAISYFSYEINPETGNYKTIGSWKSTALIDSAKVHNCKVYLTITNFNKRNNSIFLNNNEARRNSIQKIVEVLNLRKADGITVDFEGVAYSDRDLFTSYIKDLSDVLTKQEKKITIALPPIDKHKVYDVSSLQNYVTYFLVMGYGYNGIFSKTSGAEAPIEALKKSVNTYLKEGVSKEKLILVLPYYGVQWLVGNKKALTKDQFKRYVTYKTIRQTLKTEPKYDQYQKVAYIDKYFDKKLVRTIFDNEVTLGEKYDYINNNDFAGVGLWALGYDNGYNNLWDVLHHKFVSKTKKVIQQEESWIKILSQRSLLKVMLFFMFCVIISGLLLSLRHEEVRAFAFERNWTKIIILLFFPSLTILLSWKTSRFLFMIFLFLGIMLGYAIYYVLHNFIETDNNKVP